MLHYSRTSRTLLATLAISLVAAFPATQQLHAQRSSGAPSSRNMPPPPAHEILKMARSNAVNQKFAGRLRTSSSRQKVVVPFVLTMSGQTMVYEFTTPPPEALILHLGERNSRLERVTGEGKSRVSGGKLDDAVRGTDITYEDLSMQFLYWGRARFLREDTVMTRSCWLVEVTPSAKTSSQYDRVLVWVERSGALMKAECYTGRRLAAKFEVRKVQKSPRGGYVLKSMTISRPDPATGKDRSPTYLELDPIASR